MAQTLNPHSAKFASRIRAMIFRSLTWGIIPVSCFATLPNKAQPVPSPNATAQRADAKTSFSIVRVKLSPDSEADDWGIGVCGGNFWAVHVTVDELINWAYGTSARQIEHAPDWLAVDKFDVDGLIDPGTHPTRDQYGAMLQAALAERFALKLHTAKKLMPVYVLSVADGGPRISATDDQNAKPSWGVHRGWFSVTSMPFDGVAQVIQHTVFDRPVLNQTGLKDRYTFVLKWRADETQFTQMQGVDVPQEAGTADSDDIYTAARRQLGIKIEAKRAMAPVLVIDAVSRPSPN